MHTARAIRASRNGISRSFACARNLQIASRAARVLLFTVIGGPCGSVFAAGNEMTEYQLKAAYLYNFVTFTEWPANFNNSLTLCIYGPDPFGADIDKLQQAQVNGRTVRLLRLSTADQLDVCNIVFISAEVISNLRRVLDRTDNKPVLTVSDSPGAAAAGVTLNMNMEKDRITFEVNLAAVNSSSLGINFQLLRLATKVYK